ncbi:1155_t:CDS:2, partial [Scutellospora calospora]
FDQLRNLEVRLAGCFFDPKNGIVSKRCLSNLDAKSSLLDVYCRDKKEHRYIVEIVTSGISTNKENSALQLFDISVEHSKLKPVTLLAIANKLFPKGVECISYHTNREKKTK